MTVLMDLRPPINDNATDNVVALHCSLGSGQQWDKLIEACAGRYNAVAPDISGYGGNSPWLDPASSTLEIEAEHISEKLETLTGPIHLLGHSFGGAVAFKLATSGRYAHRVRSLTLIEPVLPSLLLEQDADRPLYELFVRECEYICSPIWSGEKELAVKRFLRFWNGSGYWERLSTDKKVAFLKRANKLAGDFSAVFGEAGIGEAARRLTVPTLMFSGGASPLPMQRFVKRLASIMPHAHHIHLPAADHLLPITYASEINPSILQLIDVAHS
jgi:pimeloyl-ACP methyl ester carboxylesterase